MIIIYAQYYKELNQMFSQIWNSESTNFSNAYLL